ncbi:MULTISPECIES: MarR family winged helix-turn-helix transcriptional regulator [Acetobacter]|uniref:MarR family transcriptional regulator n=2 Tax=Acetobacter TaxID=434 RepID=A0AAN1PFZ3_9PROT|nr:MULTISPECIES: MarR family winged helix-turn-helix transcriptional regulator [Acetobacter]ANA14606.1 MarR family transcriptional regulator [Acetobacter oryzifermentans]ASL41229.1 MarR family transcriptional regulator [Acetobacter oryzifermentans]AXM99448.1 MarR family transcriptional regulator [Acetobacter pomorum]KAA8386190.1 winged helix-turn-helix transcriptional regulator [Acetobacter sp. DmW_136]KAA8394592.1 winged helix-turn-helix transcriptional regulator [Acetobacter sp. DmW_125127]
MKNNKKKSEQNYALDEQVGFLLRRAYQRHTAIFQEHIPDQHLTSAQFAVLVTTHKLGQASLVQISHEAAIDHATLRDIVSRLKKRGLLKVEQSKQDRRQKLVSLMPEGEQLLHETTPVARQVTDITLSPLNECEQIAVLHILQKLSHFEV